MKKATGVAAPVGLSSSANRLTVICFRVLLTDYGGAVSSLIYCTHENEILLATDTLAVRPDGSFSCHTSKTAIVPHLNIAIAGLGVAGLSDHVYMFANSVGVSSIHELSKRLPEFLRGLWAHLNDEFGPVPDGITSTVYIFGFDDRTPYGYAHELTSDFEARQLRIPSVGAKPTDGITPEDLALKSPADIIGIMKKQKAAQDARPADKKLYIGGQIQFTIIHPGEINVMLMDALEG